MTKDKIAELIVILQTARIPKKFKKKWISDLRYTKGMIKSIEKVRPLRPLGNPL